MSTRPSAPRLFLFVTILGLMVAGSIEVAARVIFALRVGPSALGYGFTTDEPLDNVGNDAHKRRTLGGVGDDYVKYAPNQIRFDNNPRSGDRFRVSINSRGLRGADYPDEKSPGTTRVITLGASSTFGYYNRDETTYPVLLEEILNRECENAGPFEVINLGIPHLKSEEIAAILTHEGIKLAPDFVTYYEGVNDAVEVRNASPNAASASKPAPQDLAALRTIYRFLYDHFISFAFLDSVLRGGKAQLFDTASVRAHFVGKSEHWRSSLDRIDRLATEHAFQLLVANQQSKAEFVPVDEIRGVTYQQEMAMVQAKFDRGEDLNIWERAFLIHGQLMNETESWASEKNIPFVDIIEATNDRRDILLSWVHLTPEGNEIVARAFADALLEVACPQGS